MEDNGSYPPINLKNDNNAQNDSFEEESKKIEPDPEPDGVEWDGSEAEIVLDDDSEEYEDEDTGIKIKYALRASEINQFIKHSNIYRKNLKFQRKHTIVQSAILIAMLVFFATTQVQQYLWIAALPIVAIALIWCVPHFGLKKLVREIFSSDSMNVEIFSDRIEVNHKTYNEEIPLDGSHESEELENMILIYSKDAPVLIIPQRSIEPEFAADVQAMIFAGTMPRDKQ